MIQSSSASDRYERAVAFYINTFDNVKATRPKVGTSYSDIFCEFNGTSSWIEVKMNETDQLGSPRVLYNGEKWSAVKMGPIQRYVCDKMNKSFAADNVLDELRTHTGRDNIFIPSTKGGLNHPHAVSLEMMEMFFLSRSDRYIYQQHNANISKLVEEHYNFGKTEPAHYISAGDSFYRLGDEDPFELNVPKFIGSGRLAVRITIRSQFYEIQPELKIKNLEPSPFSIAPGTNKPNPFTHCVIV